MGMIGRILGIGQAAENIGGAVENVAEVFTVNKTKAELAAYAQSMASLEQYGSEFSNPSQSWFDVMINGINRLPRPIMAIGTIGLFVYAMARPIGFAERMQGLAYVPDPLWWLLGAVVSFYFGARELHYTRSATRNPVVISLDDPDVSSKSKPLPEGREISVEAANGIVANTSDPDFNPALTEWLTAQHK